MHLISALTAFEVSVDAAFLNLHFAHVLIVWRTSNDYELCESQKAQEDWG